MGSKHPFAISGITYEYAERLQEEGIMNVQNLAFADPDVLSKRTRLNRDMILDWKDQAILMLLTGDAIAETLKKKEEVNKMEAEPLPEKKDTEKKKKQRMKKKGKPFTKSSGMLA